MKKNKLLTLSVILILFFAMIPSFLGNATKIDNIDNKTIFKANKVRMVKGLSIKSNGFSALDGPDIDILVSDETGNESNPSIAVDNNKVVVGCEYQFGENNSVLVKQSDDFGLSFSNDVFLFNNASNPSFTKTKYGKNFCGAFLSTNCSSNIYELELPGSGEANLWDYRDISQEGVTDPIGDFLNFEAIDVVSYPHPVINFIIATIGDGEFIPEYDEYNCDDSPIFLYKDINNPVTNRTIVFFPEVTDCNNISICVSENISGNETVYGVCEQFDSSKNNLLFFYGNHDLWAREEEELLRKSVIEYPEDIYNPQIASIDNNLYVVVKTESNKIKLFHSSDYGAEGSWNVYNVTNNSVPVDTEPSNINIYTYEDKVMVTYVNLSNLYRVESEDNGSSWSEPDRVNNNLDSVQSGERNTDIGDSDRIIWTDNREEDNTDLYMVLGYTPAIDLNITNIELTRDRLLVKTNNYLAISVKNDGNVPYDTRIILNVTYEDNTGNITKIEYPFEILGGLDPGEEKTVEHRFFQFSGQEYFNAIIELAGIQNITAKIEEQSTPLFDSNLDNNMLTKAVSYEDIFPVLGKSQFLETFLLIIKKITDFMGN